MAVTVALAGDTMLGRGVARTLATTPPGAMVAPEVLAALGEADLVVLNLECCISEHGRRWDAPGKPFFFRAPPRAVELLVLLGVDCLTLANNHALDYGFDALADTLDHLAQAGIAVVGAGADLQQARRPAIVAAGGLRVAVVGVTDHPADFAAGADRPGVAFADLGRQVPDWLLQAVREVGAEPPPPWWTRERRWSPATPPTCPTESPAGSCTTWATSWTTMGSTGDCATTSACCSWSPSTVTCRFGWRRSP